MVIFPLAPDQTIAQMWSNGARGGRKPLEIEPWFQRTINRKWPMGNQMVTWPRKVSDPNTLRVQYRDNNWRCYLATIAITR